MKLEKFLVKHGEDFVRDSNWTPKRMTYKQALKYATSINKRGGIKNHRGVLVFEPVVTLVEPPVSQDKYFRIVLAGK